MTRSPLLDSFDPFAIHPFTNNSGLTPLPPLPSLYPLPIPSQPTYPGLPTSSSSTQTINSISSMPNIQNTPSFFQPQSQPVPLPKASPSRSPPIFVPYRRDTSSPDLVLKKKKLRDGAPQPTKWCRYPRSDISNVRSIPASLIRILKCPIVFVNDPHEKGNLLKLTSWFLLSTWENKHIHGLLLSALRLLPRTFTKFLIIGRRSESSLPQIYKLIVFDHSQGLRISLACENCK